MNFIIIDPPRILKNPESQSKPYREEVSFTVTASGLNLCYQWRKDGQDLCDSGEYSRSGTSILFIKSFSHELEGNYNCIVKNSGGEIESKKAKLSFSGMHILQAMLVAIWCPHAFSGENAEERPCASSSCCVC